jgi:hypothetical protein
MPLQLCRLVPVLALLLAPSVVRGEGTPQTPPEPIEGARLIVIGEVSAYGVMDEEHEDGGKTNWVLLRVCVESVVKGSAPVKPGDTMHIMCRAPVRPAFDGTLPSGHHAIPGNGSRAKFYLGGETLGIWSPVTPNGIEPLDETPRLEFPIEPVVNSRGGHGGRWPVRLLACAAVVGLLLFASLRSRRRGAGLGTEDRDQPAPTRPR